MQEACTVIPRPIRILIVEDHRAWRSAIFSLLQSEPDFQIIDQAVDGLEGVRKAIETSPDIILLDIGLPGLNGLEAARQIRQVCPASRILFFSEYRSTEMAEEALRIGAGGYVIKSRAGDELVLAIRAVLAGKVFLSAGIDVRSGKPNPFEAFRDNSAIPKFLESIVHASKADFGNIKLFDSANNVLKIVAHVGLESEFLEYFATVNHDSHTVCSAAMDERRRVICRDISEWPLPSRRAAEVLARAQVRSSQSTPLLCAICGFMGVVSTQYTHTGGPPLEVLTQVDDLTSGLIANLCG